MEQSAWVRVSQLSWDFFNLSRFLFINNHFNSIIRVYFLCFYSVSNYWFLLLLALLLREAHPLQAKDGSPDWNPGCDAWFISLKNTRIHFWVSWSDYSLANSYWVSWYYSRDVQVSLHEKKVCQRLTYRWLAKMKEVTSDLALLGPTIGMSWAPGSYKDI